MAELRFLSWLRLHLAQEGMLICFSPLLKGKVRVASESAQRGHKGGSGCSLSSKTSPFFPIFIVPLPVYLHTAFLDDFFWRSFPYTQAETTRVFRTRDESSPLSKDTSRVCAEISTCFIRRVLDPRRVRKGAEPAVTA
jgi:hypothetical protein